MLWEQHMIFVQGEIFSHKHKYNDSKNLDEFVSYIKEHTEWQDSCKDYTNDPPLQNVQMVIDI